MVLRIFLRVIAQRLYQQCPGADVCVVDGVFEVVPGEVGADDQAPAPGVIFHPASGIDEAAVAKAQADLRRLILRAFVGRALIESFDAKDMLAYQHSGF